MKANEDIIVKFDKEDYKEFLQKLNLIVFKDHKIYWKMAMWRKFVPSPRHELYIADIFDKVYRLCEKNANGKEFDIDIIEPSVGMVYVFYHFIDDDVLQVLELHYGDIISE